MRIFGINVNPLTLKEFFHVLFEKIELGEKYLIGHINVRGANFAIEDENFRNYYDKCNLITCDGIGVLIGGYILGKKVSFDKRITAPDYLDDLLFNLQKRKSKIYFLSSTPRVIELLNNKLGSKFPDLNFKSHHGYFDKEGFENEMIIDDINEFDPDVLYIGFGMPLQELWIVENYDKLKNMIVLPLGACLDFYTGETYRGPNLLTNNGFEWITRLFTQPFKLWKRYIIGNPLFLIRVLREKYGF